MIKIAITGNIAGGKTTALNIAKKLGYPTIDCDKIYHELLKKNKKLKNLLVKEFGNCIIDEQGKVNTILLRKLLNIQPKKLKLLENITHPLVLKEVWGLIKKYERQKKNIVFVDVPLLFEKNLQSKFDYVVTIYCSQRVQKKRIEDRGISLNDISFLLANQLPVEKKVKLSDYSIKNDNISQSQLKRKLTEIIDNIKSHHKL